MNILTFFNANTLGDCCDYESPCEAVVVVKQPRRNRRVVNGPFSFFFLNTEFNESTCEVATK